MRKLLQLFKNKFEDRAYAAEEKLLWWEEHVRWFCPTYPILIDISDRVKNNKREMMRSRNELIEKYGDSGLSLPELIVVNDEFRDAAVLHGGWSYCQVNSGNYIPFYFGKQVQYLFNTESHKVVCKTRIPVLEVYVASGELIPVFEAAIKKLYAERKLPLLTYSAPRFKYFNVNRDSEKSTIEVKTNTLVQPFQHLYFQG